MHYADVAIPARVFHPFTYRFPEGTRLTPGMRVDLPFHRRHIVGYVLSIASTLPQHLHLQQLKEIRKPLDVEPIFSSAMLNLITWMATYYCAPIGEVCRAVLPKRLTQLTPIKTSRPSTPFEIKVQQSHAPAFTLTEGQQQALDTIATELNAPQPKPLLLHGITGSGKTEIYLRLFADVQKKGGQAILLVPEIGLTPQLASRVTERFGQAVAIYHSSLTDAQRYDQWKKMKAGDIAIVIGTRSALFAPLPNLKAIVIDEEHDSAYKQDDGFLYHARDTAVMRGHLEKAIVILGSATPSFESFANAQNGKYRYLHLSERATGAHLPHVELIDMRLKHATTSEQQFEGKLALSETLAVEIEKTIIRKEQTLLFLNRRGFANFLLCETCGFVFMCPNCNISLTSHHKRGCLLCHYCEHTIPHPLSCAKCTSTALLSMGGGTERLEAELNDFFPHARIARLDGDTVLKQNLRQRLFRDMHEGNLDILVGTQLITKGHDFPNVTLVGIIQADTSLHLPDFRAAERTFQLITQVSGRAGRADKPGRVIVQTYHPEHHSLRHAKEHSFKAFFTEECALRESLGYPPFGRLANIRFSGKDQRKVIDAARAITNHLRTTNAFASTGMSILGPAAAPLEKIRNKYRWQCLIKSPSPHTFKMVFANVHERLNHLLPSGVRLTIDVDPTNLL